MAKTFRNNSMNNVPPVFEKKGINYSGYIYNYLPVDMPVYTAEVTHRDQVSGELLYNAAKFSDGKHICLHVYETRRSVCFKVEDVGPGLPENAEELLYKPFVKNDNMSEGLGLGLPLTKRHALSLGGDLIYDPDYKDGCCFVLELPK